MAQAVYICRFLALTIAAIITSPVLAQTPPDAGQLLQEQRTAPTLPTPSPDFRIEPQTPAESAPGGAEVVVQRVELVGNSVIDEATLQAVLGEVAGASFDLAGLRGLANRITTYYASNGYPFARAFLPAQTASDGVIRIEIIEGRYGRVSIQGDDALIARSDGFLNALVPGEVIENRLLERTTLILNDQPGISISPVMRPGEVLGSGDLDVRVTREPGFGGEIGLNNHGNRYTGSHRLRADLQADSPFLFGDQLSLRSLYTEEGMWLGSVTYSLPLGHSGLRGSISHAHTDYELAKDFKDLDATGTADVTSVGLSYPLVRSQQQNLTLAVSYQYKAMRDKQGATDTDTDTKKNSSSVPLSVQFDRRDTLGGGGIVFGNVTWTHGRLKLDSQLKVDDDLNFNTNGSFNKLNLDVVRLQATPLNGLNVYARAATQWADGNLDASEGFSLGGANGVRAYPSGEGSGDEGWLMQLELRYSMGSSTPYVFYDAGYTRANAKPTQASGNTKTRIAGGGVGLRYQREQWSMDAAAAWRGNNNPTADTKDQHPRFWLNVGYRF